MRDGEMALQSPGITLARASFLDKKFQVELEPGGDWSQDVVRLWMGSRTARATAGGS